MTYGDLLEYLRPLTDNDLGKTAQVLVRSGLGRPSDRSRRRR
jgi:hypothetical protein